MDVSLPGIFLRLHSIWSINPRWNVVYLFKGHTANSAKGWLTSSGIVPKKRHTCNLILVRLDYVCGFYNYFVAIT